VSRGAPNLSPRIDNRRAFHQYFITHKIECGMVLLGSEVKSLRNGKAQLAESYASVDRGELILHGCHIDPYEKAHIGHEPLRERKLLVHKRELVKIEGELEVKGHHAHSAGDLFQRGNGEIGTRRCPRQAAA
jgi:SsrA-binding protein